MYKMIVCDLDETLLKDDGELSEKNIGAIKTAVEKGVYFVPNSGRSYLSFENVLKETNLSGLPDQYSISYNGGLILENEDNRTIQVNSMDYEIAKTIFEIGISDANADVHVYLQDDLFIYGLKDDDANYLTSRGVEFNQMDSNDFSIFKNKNIMKIIMDLPTMELRKEMQQKVESKVNASALATTFSSDRYVEFNPAGVDKGSAAIQLGEKLNIKSDEIIAVGDNGNDLSMLKVVGLPISVANGLDSVKQAAKYITKSDNNHDALAEIINKFIL
ncbi:Cof-type HAD-IIB family hydrolase [Companilactobacillus ginsenosidimutans]|uniref:HAD family hydrolase n=1 Tax=Companilactobacillus ginsenosidimutans TaxID=1007676 RepID=A0A0H4QIX5_9LACO|nr:Cof-type HAD-IIB family hydrolase [Companilactobacillus ginsenosidimutans]AKP66633.1 HAD family hydrolase [Companilactobacillus ginsenosidimutans]